MTNVNFKKQQFRKDINHGINLHEKRFDTIEYNPLMLSKYKKTQECHFETLQSREERNLNSKTSSPS